MPPRPPAPPPTGRPDPPPRPLPRPPWAHRGPASPPTPTWARPRQSLAAARSPARARARAALSRVAEAAPLWQAWPARDPRPQNWQLEALRFARALLNEPSVAHSE